MVISTLRRAALTMLVVTVAARAIGYVREAVIAQVFGVSREVDLFLAAMTVPAVLVSVAYYSIPNALVPLWASGRHRRAVAAALGVTLAAALISGGIAWLAPLIMEAVARGFDPELQRRAASLLRLTSVTIVLSIVEASLRSRLLADKQFGLPGLSYVSQGVGVVIAVLGWPGYGASAIAWGLVMGTVGSVLWNVALLFRGHPGRGTCAVEATRSSGPGRVWVWVTVVLMTDFLYQLYSVVDRYYGSFLQSGAIAALNYANLIGGLPTSIIGVALSSALLPFLSDSESERDGIRTASLVDSAVRWSLLLSVPATIWMIAFRSEIVGVLLQRGAFDMAARDLTSLALAAVALGVVPAVLTTVWSRLFYASRRWLPIVLIAIIALTAKLLLAGWLMSQLGLPGLALATSGASIAAATVAVAVQRHRIIGSISHWALIALKIMILVGVPATATWAILTTLDADRLYTRAGIAGLGVLAGLMALSGFGKTWGVTRLMDLKEFINTRTTA